MNAAEPPTGPSPARLGGFVLIGVGVLAGVFGVATLVAGQDETEAQPQNPPGGATSVVTPTDTSESTTTRSSVTTSSPAPTSPTTREEPDKTRDPGRAGDPAPGGSGGGDGGRTGKGGEVSREAIKLRVYNNSKISGLAHRAAKDFRDAGYNVVEIGNYARGRIPVTTVYYRPNTHERAQAQQVAKHLDARIESRFPGIDDASSGVIVIVTKNYDGPG